MVICWFMKIMFCSLSHVVCIMHTFKNSKLQRYSSAIVVSVTYYKQRIFGERAVIVRSAAQMLCNTVHLSSPQPINRTLKALANWSSPFIQHKSYICNWALVLYLSSPLPPASQPCFIWVHNHNGLSNGSKIPFPWTKSLCGSCGLWDPNNLN